ncbi:MAG: hypothetical protein ACKOCN_10785, partial [Planctomycetaceae bacterium]
AFDYSGPLAESVLLANVAYRLGVSFDWNADSLTVHRVVSNSGVSPSPSDISRLLARDYRAGWHI